MAALLSAPLMSAAVLQKPVPRPAKPADGAPLAERMRQIAERPILRHALLGYEIYDLSSGRVLLEQNADKLFNAGSTAKLLTEGAALALLGPEFRFHTRVYYTGKLQNDGTLEGDLFLVAGGDCNLSGRVKADDTLDYTTSDHSYAGVTNAFPVWGDPLRVMKELASGVLMQGVARVHGRVLVDASLFPSTQEPATHTVISPVMLNDNVIDVTVTSSATVGAPAEVKLSPELPYLHLLNHVTTSGPDSESELQFASDVTEADGSQTVVLEGHVPAGRRRALAAYKVKEPVLYAQMGFQQALEWAGVKVEEPAAAAPAAELLDPARTLLTEHLSPPLREEVRLTLKVSQNLHAATMPYLIGTFAPGAEAQKAGAHRDPAQRGMALERRWLAEAGLEPEMVSQLDGEGGVGSAFSPEFMVRYLEYALRQPWGTELFQALPVLGRDGTLTEVLKESPAAGKVHAKSGTYAVANNLNGGVMLLGKGLVGAIDAANHHRLIFAAYVNLMPLRSMDDVIEVSGTLAEMAAAAYQYAPGKPLPGPAATTNRKGAPAKAEAKPKTAIARKVSPAKAKPGKLKAKPAAAAAART